MNSPFFSVVIPTFNRHKLLARCLDSLCNQTFKDFETLVCDDGSTDATKSVVELYKSKLEIRYFWDQNWGGPARPRNTGIQHARSQWICFLDSDDWWYPQKLEIIKSYLQYDVIYHDLDYFTDLGIQKPMRGTQLGDNPFYELIAYQNCIPNSSAVVKTDLLKRIGCISENQDIIAIEDYDTWIRLSLEGARFKYINKSLGAYWQSKEANNISASTKFIDRELTILDQYSALIPLKSRSNVIQSRLFNIARNAHRVNHFDNAIKTYIKCIHGPSIVISIKALILTFLGLLKICR